MIKFYTFNQNNSGGSFHLDKDAGLTHYVIFQATSKEDTIDRAEKAGIYFDGVDDDTDCQCCGDRWYVPYDDEGTITPEIYGKPVQALIAEAKAKRNGMMLWMEEGYEVCVHLLDGTKQWA
jgi:hypothetical protein